MTARTHPGDRFLCLDRTESHDWWTVGHAANTGPMLTLVQTCNRCGLVLILDDGCERPSTIVTDEGAA